MQNIGLASVEPGSASSSIHPAQSRDSEDSAQPPVSPGGWLREGLRRLGRTVGSLLLGGAAVLGAMFAFRQGALPLIESALGLDAAAVSAVRRVGLLCAALLAYWAFVRFYERRAAAELSPRPLPILLGGLGGALLVAVPIALLFALGAYALVGTRELAWSLSGVAAVIALAATLEELIYRCLLFRIVERSWGTWIALIVQALIFAVQHLENVEGADLSDVVTMLVAVTVVGLLWAGVFVLTRSLWAAAANHAAWNFTILLSGVPLSGIEDWRAMAPLQTELAGPVWLTGGMFGPESSVLVIASASLATVWLLRRARSKGQIRPLA
jgi:membrane protease YdiL (CAAX protease family)